MAKKLDTDEFIDSPSYMVPEDFSFISSDRATRTQLRKLSSSLVTKIEVKDSKIVDWDDRKLIKDKRLGAMWNLVNIGLQHVSEELKEGQYKYDIKEICKTAARIQAQIVIETNVNNYQERDARQDFVFNENFEFYCQELKVDCRGIQRLGLSVPDRPGTLGYFAETKSCARYFGHNFDFEKYFPKFHEHIPESNCFLELDIRARQPIEKAVGMKPSSIRDYEDLWKKELNTYGSHCSEFRYIDDSQALVNFNMPGAGLSFKEIFEGLSVEPL